jgi:hypothetical protein
MTDQSEQVVEVLDGARPGGNWTAICFLVLINTRHMADAEDTIRFELPIHPYGIVHGQESDHPNLPGTPASLIHDGWHDATFYTVKLCRLPARQREPCSKVVRKFFRSVTRT